MYTLKKVNDFSASSRDVTNQTKLSLAENNLIYSEFGQRHPG
jgi:hypothetical protein